MDPNLKRLLRSETYLCVAALLIFAAVTAFYRYFILAAALAGTALVLVGLSVILSRQRAKGVAAYVQSSVDVLSDQVAANAPYPMATVRLSTGEILWHNHQFAKLLGQSDSKVGKPITAVFPDFGLDWVRAGKVESEEDLVWRDRRFRTLGYVPKSGGEKQDVALLQWLDSTELLTTRDEYLRSRPVVSIILIDNYDELTNNLTDTAVSTLNAAIGQRISTWAENIGGLLRKLERNRFLFLFEAKDLYRITEGKFSLLDNIRQVTSPSGIAATLSFGVGKDGASFQEDYDFAALALEMALSRGGDQAVIKDKYDFSFYGGRSVEAERRTKVKSRVMASSLSALIEQSSRVFVMGHKNADFDAIGAAAGVCALCRAKEKRAQIVVDLKNNAAGRLIDLLREEPHYKDGFVSAQDALIQADARTLLVVVDTNRPEMVESQALLESLNRVAVIDHHRRAADYISNAALSLHEPFASSASELVTELLMYAVDAKDILPGELKALLAGIVLDTKNFTVRVNSRTFEAAAFLRYQGADPVEVKRLFQSDFEQTVRRYQIIEAARVYRDSLAVACEDREISRALAGQAADELLNIDGIDTSFVLFRQPDGIYISARSLGKVNVQMVLEPLGGGGNAASAGAQLKGRNMETARQEVIKAIDNYFES